MAIEYREQTSTGVGTVLRDLFENSVHLVRQEINLVKAEVREQISETVSTAGRGVGLMVGGALFAALGLALLAVTIIFALNSFLGWAFWLAALVVTLAYFIVGAILAYAGQQVLKSSRTPDDTAQLPT